MSTKTTRRAVLAGAATLATVAVPATVAFASGNPDAELIELGRQLDAWVPRYETAHRLSQPNWDERERRIKESRGKNLSIEKYKQMFEEVDRDVPPPTPDWLRP